MILLPFLFRRLGGVVRGTVAIVRAFQPTECEAFTERDNAITDAEMPARVLVTRERMVRSDGARLMARSMRACRTDARYLPYRS